MKILLLEYEQKTKEMIIEFLTLDGNSIVCYQTDSSILNQNYFDFDIIIMELKFTGELWCDVLDYIRRKNKTIKIIIHSSYLTFDNLRILKNYNNIIIHEKCCQNSLDDLLNLVNQIIR